MIDRKAADHRIGLLALMLITMAAVWLRFAHFSQLIVMDDEWHALHAMMQLDFGELFQTFGHADHSIPIALWLKTLAVHVGLNEWRMGLPFLMAGVAAVLLLPWRFRHWLRPDESLVLAFLLSFSALLIFYSQQARPYALLVLTVPIAVVALWQFRSQGRLGQLLAFVITGVASAWLHPLMLAWLGWALVVAAGFGLWDLRHDKGWISFWRMVIAGAVLMALSASLLAWPVLNDLASLQVKTGADQVQAQTFWIAWQLFIGHGSHLVGVLALGLAVLGGVELARRDAPFLAYWLLIALGSLGMIAATNAAWLHHGLVLARYSVPLQIFAFVLISIGLHTLARSVISAWPRQLLIGIVLIAWVATGPLPEIKTQPNAWAKHMLYHFDYRKQRNVYRQHFASIEMPQAYREIGHAQGPGRVFEAGWWFEAHFNPLVIFQQLYQRKVGIVMLNGRCMDWTHGEFPHPAHRVVSHQFEFRNFVFLDDIERHIQPGDFVVFHRHSLLPDARPRPDPSNCIAQARQLLGPPWFEDDSSVVFRSQVMDHP